MRNIFVFLSLSLVFARGFSQNKNALSMGFSLAGAGNRSSIIRDDSSETYATGYIGGIAEYSYYPRGYFVDSIPASAKRWCLGWAARVNYTRYGIAKIVHWSEYHYYEASIRNIEFNLVQSTHFRISRKTAVNFSVMGLYRIKSITGDSVVFNLYGLKTPSGRDNIRNFGLNAGIELSCRLAPKLRLNIGYVNGLVNIVRENRDQFPVLREFYPYIRITKIL